MSSSILLLLTRGIGLIAVSARRAQELARQQMEFVAAVSHELRTPVSVIGAAAGNLADGVVGDPQRVRKYGETIQGEARRLGETVERVLQLAGIAAGSAAAAQTPVSPADLVHESTRGVPRRDRAAGFNVEVGIAEGLPNVVGDVAALKSALQNSDQQRGQVRRQRQMATRCRAQGSGIRDQGSGAFSPLRIAASASMPTTASTSSSRSIAAVMRSRNRSRAAASASTS